MKNSKPGQWQRTSPLAALFFFGKLLKALVKNAWQSLFPLLAYISVSQAELVTSLKIGVGAFLAITIAGSILSYLFFRFQINDDSILIRQGVIKKKQVDIKFDRIQGINTQQNVVYRFFGLVTISFDTAGSTGDEGSLPAVSQAFADALRSRISSRGKSLPGDSEAAVVENDALLNLNWRDMIRIGLADRRALIVLAAIGTLSNQLEGNMAQIPVKEFESYAAGFVGTSISAGVTMAVLAAAALVLLLVLISVAAAFLRYHNFALRLDDDTLRSHGGLLTRHEVSMRLGKIQTLRLEQGIVMRWLGRYQLSGRQARSGRKQGENKNFVIPVVTEDTANHLRELLLAPEGDGLVQIPTSKRFERVSPYYMRTRLIAISLLPAILGATLLASETGLASLFVLLWIPASGLLIYQNWRRAGYLCSSEGFVRRSGVLGYRCAALLYRKVQRVTVSQSRYQRRKGLASLRVYMASGSVRIPYIELALANKLRDYILYKVESSEQAWH